MAKVLTDVDGTTHLRGKADSSLCGELVDGKILGGAVTDGILTCPECVKIALHAVELVTKAEKREWRKL
jgi:hypothetical protein